MRLIAIARTVLSDLGSNLVSATHQYLVPVTAVDSDLVDEIVNSRSLWICNVVATGTVVSIAGSCTGQQRDHRCRRVHLHWCGLGILTALPLVLMSSIIPSETYLRSCVHSPPGQHASASQTRSSRSVVVGLVSTRQNINLLRSTAHPGVSLDRTVSSSLRLLALHTTRTHPAHWCRHSMYDFGSHSSV